MPSVAQRLRLVLAASLLAGAVDACQGADPYYRNRADAGVGAAAGFSGFSGAAGFAGTTGAGGSTGTAGTTGAAGAGVAGTMGAGACTTCMVKVMYTCRSDDTGQASFVLNVTNESSTVIPLSSLTLRYWYTIVDHTITDVAAADQQQLDCDFAKLGCTNVVTSDTTPAPKFVPVMPPRDIDMKTVADEYAEIAFKAGALALDPFLDTGEIQLRLHNKSFSPIKQSDDYSFDCSMKNAAVTSTKVTAYLDGVLVWGTEPP